MEIYKINEYGSYTPFNLDEYTEEVRSQTYIKTRREQRERAKARKKQKEQTLLRRLFGFGMLAASIGLCRITVALGEKDISYMIILIPLALVFMFGKDEQEE